MRFDFICGCGHSGTTLLLKMLGQASGVFTPKRETDMMFSKKGVDQIKEDLIVKAKKNGCVRIVEKPLAISTMLMK